jgi:hypothetical protein
MSSILDIFNNTTSLAIIAILLLVIGLCFLFVYIEYVKRDQNHKIASMLSLVTSITEEVHSIRNFMSVITSGQVSHISVSNVGGVPQSQELNSYEEENNIQRRDASDEYDEKDDLIEVSDDEEEGNESIVDSDADDEEDSDEEDNDDADEEDDEDLDEDEDDNLEENENEVHNNSDIEDLEDDGTENEDDCEPIEESVFKLNNDSNELESLVVEDEVVADIVADLIEEVEVKETEPDTINLEEQSSVITQEQKNVLKTISITSLEDDGIRIVETLDYKKMSLPKLKQVVVEKKLAADASKLKKHDLLKLLGVEA